MVGMFFNELRCRMVATPPGLVISSYDAWRLTLFLPHFIHLLVRGSVAEILGEPRIAKVQRGGVANYDGLSSYQRGFVEEVCGR